MPRLRPLALLTSALLLCPPLLAQEVDLGVVHRIKQEAFEHSEVMDHLFALTDANGPRLTNSPGFRHAADWAVGRLKGWGFRTPGWSRGASSAAAGRSSTSRRISSSLCTRRSTAFRWRGPDRLMGCSRAS